MRGETWGRRLESRPAQHLKVRTPDENFDDYFNICICNLYVCWIWYIYLRWACLMRISIGLLKNPKYWPDWFENAVLYWRDESWIIPSELMGQCLTSTSDGDSQGEFSPIYWRDSRWGGEAWISTFAEFWFSQVPPMGELSLVYWPVWDCTQAERRRRRRSLD